MAIYIILGILVFILFISTCILMIFFYKKNSITIEKNAELNNIKNNLKECNLALNVKDANALMLQENINKLNVDVNSRINEVNNQKELNKQLIKSEEAIKKMVFELEKNLKLTSVEILKDREKKSLESISNNLIPFKKDLSQLEKLITEARTESNTNKGSLEQELKQLHEATNKYSREADKLVKALSSNAKAQGNYGEINLQQLLEIAGFQENVSYTKETYFKDNEDGEESSGRYDFVINLPNNSEGIERKVIIDCKVSLKAFIDFVNATNEEDSKKYKNRLIKSIQDHIKNLDKKNYEKRSKTFTNYVIMYIPHDIIIDIINDYSRDKATDIIDDAFKKNIILQTPNSILMTLKTIDNLTRNQIRNDSFSNFQKLAAKISDEMVFLVQYLDEIGDNLNKLSKTYNKIDKPKNKLKDDLEMIKGYKLDGKKIIKPNKKQLSKAKEIDMREADILEED